MNMEYLADKLWMRSIFSSAIAVVQADTGSSRVGMVVKQGGPDRLVVRERARASVTQCLRPNPSKGLAFGAQNNYFSMNCASGRLAIRHDQRQLSSDDV